MMTTTTSLQRLIDCVREAYPDTEVLIRTNVTGEVQIKNPERETVEMPAHYFVNVFKRNVTLPIVHPDAYLSFKAYGPTLEGTLRTAINLRDPELLLSRGL